MTVHTGGDCMCCHTDFENGRAVMRTTGVFQDKPVENYLPKENRNGNFQNEGSASFDLGKF